MSVIPCLAHYGGSVLEEQISKAKLQEYPRFSDEEDLNLLDIVKANPNLTSGVAVIIGTQIARSFGASKLAQKIAGRGCRADILPGWLVAHSTSRRLGCRCRLSLCGTSSNCQGRISASDSRCSYSTRR